MTEYKARREALFQKMQPNSLAIVSSASPTYRNNDAEYMFRQDSYFYYLTGFEESYSIAVFIKYENKNEFILFCQEKNPDEERWTGKRLGVQGAQFELGADQSYAISEAQFHFPKFFRNIHTVYYLVGKHPAFERKLFGWIQNLQKMQRQGITPPEKYHDLRVLLDESRLFKDPNEIEHMQKAAAVTVEGHLRAMKAAKPGRYEYDLEGELRYAFCQGGCQNMAYNPIVATGENACILHYTANNCVLKENELVLIDAGAEFKNYAADVTRTFPVNGKFTSEQQALYEIVLEAQVQAIDQVKPGVPWDQVQSKILQVMVQGLVDLELLNGEVNELIEQQAYKPFYMHNSGHWLGLDVHDVGDYKKQGDWRALQENMVLTVEPGLYIDSEEFSVPEKWRGIGIRIEDDVLVTSTGNKVLSSDCPKTVKDIIRHIQS